ALLVAGGGRALLPVLAGDRADDLESASAEGVVGDRGDVGAEPGGDDRRRSRGYGRGVHAVQDGRAGAGGVDRGVQRSGGERAADGENGAVDDPGAAGGCDTDIPSDERTGGELGAVFQ